MLTIINHGFPPWPLQTSSPVDVRVQNGTSGLLLRELCRSPGRGSKTSGAEDLVKKPEDFYNKSIVDL